MTARRLAGITLGTCLLLALGTLLLLVVGAGVSTRADSFVPGNPIGPIFLVTVVALGAGDFAFQYADRALFIDPRKASR